MGTNRAEYKNSKEKKVQSIAKRFNISEQKLFELLNYVFLKTDLNPEKDLAEIIDYMILTKRINEKELKYFAVVGFLEFLLRYNEDKAREIWQRLH